MRFNEQLNAKKREIRERIEQAIRPIIEEYEEREGIVVESIQPSYYEVTKMSDPSRRFSLERVKVSMIFVEGMGF